MDKGKNLEKWTSLTHIHVTISYVALKFTLTFRIYWESVFQIWCKSCKNSEIKKIYSDHKLTVSLSQIILNSTFFQCF